jgi:hypothetical protein
MPLQFIALGESLVTATNLARKAGGFFLSSLAGVEEQINARARYSTTLALFVDDAERQIFERRVALSGLYAGPPLLVHGRNGNLYLITFGPNVFQALAFNFLPGGAVGDEGAAFTMPPMWNRDP